MVGYPVFSCFGIRLIGEIVCFYKLYLTFNINYIIFFYRYDADVSLIDILNDLYIVIDIIFCVISLRVNLI